MAIVKDILIVFFQEKEDEIGIKNKFIQLADVELEVRVINLEAKDKILEVEGTDVGVGIIAKHFDSSGWVHKVAIEERWVGFSIDEYCLGGVIFELSDGPSISEQPLHLYYLTFIKYLFLNVFHQFTKVLPQFASFS